MRVVGLVTRFAPLAVLAMLGSSLDAHAEAPGPAPEVREPRAPSREPPAAAPARASEDGAAPQSMARSSPFIGGTSTCPSPASVWTELGTLVPTERLDAYQANRVARSPMESNPPPAVEIVDLGLKFRVLAGGRAREYRDDAQDCTYRARVAAVFVALAVDPAAVLAEPPPPPVPSPPPAPAPERPPPPVVAARLVQVEIGVGVDRSLGSGPRATQLGGGLRVILGRGPVALVVGAAAFLAKDAELNGLHVNQRHDPLDLGLRARWQGSFVEPYAEIGLGLALISEEALNLGTNASGQTVEPGGFAVIGAHLAARSRVGFFVAGRAEWIPSPVQIRALPTGVVGHAPAFWAGATCGLSVGF